MQDVGEILVGIESIFLCRDDEGVEDGTGLSCKQRSGCFMNVIVEPSLERLDE